MLIVGGKPGAALPGVPVRALVRRRAALPRRRLRQARSRSPPKAWRTHPQNPSLRYQLACYEALNGNREAAIRHLQIAYANNPATREWASGDEDLDSIRDDPALR